jgi:hypothetical protein
MVKKKYNDDLFVYLNWILKKPVKVLQLQNIPSTFITNRWLSMVNKDTASIVNATFNRWLTVKSFSSDNLLAGKFYRILIPSSNKRINYFKKGTLESSKNVEDLSQLAKNLEMSQKEIEMYNQTLDYLGI